MSFVLTRVASCPFDKDGRGQKPLEATVGVGSRLQCRRTPNTKSTSILGTVVGIVASYSILKCYYRAVPVGEDKRSLPHVCGPSPAWALPVPPTRQPACVHSRQSACAPFRKVLPLRPSRPRVLLHGWHGWHGWNGCMDGYRHSEDTIVVIGGIAAARAACPVGTTQGRCCLE